jgi:hypothetical protein
MRDAPERTVFIADTYVNMTHGQRSPRSRCLPRTRSAALGITPKVALPRTRAAAAAPKAKKRRARLINGMNRAEVEAMQAAPTRSAEVRSRSREGRANR